MKWPFVLRKTLEKREAETRVRIGTLIDRINQKDRELEMLRKQVDGLDKMLADSGNAHYKEVLHLRKMLADRDQTIRHLEAEREKRHVDSHQSAGTAGKRNSRDNGASSPERNHRGGNLPPG